MVPNQALSISVDLKLIMLSIAGIFKRMGFHFCYVKMLCYLNRQPQSLKCCSFIPRVLIRLIRLPACHCAFEAYRMSCELLSSQRKGPGTNSMWTLSLCCVLSYFVFVLYVFKAPRRLHKRFYQNKYIIISQAGNKKRDHFTVFGWILKKT